MEITTPEIPKCLVNAFPPDAFALFMSIRQQVDEEMLAEIANADCGYDFEENLAALHRMRDQFELLVPIKWEPHEALSLSRWNEPGPNQRFQIKRVFCCICLLMAATHPDSWNLIHSQVDTMIQLLDSVVALNREWSIAYAQFITWRLQQIPADGESERPFFSLALFYLAILTRNIAETHLPVIADWLICEETADRKEHGEHVPDKESWLLGLTFFNQSHGIWRANAQRVIDDSVWIESQAIRERIHDIARRLIGKTTTT